MGQTGGCRQGLLVDLPVQDIELRLVDVILHPRLRHLVERRAGDHVPVELVHAVASALRGFRGEWCPSLADYVREPEGHLRGDRRRGLMLATLDSRLGRAVGFALLVQAHLYPRTLFLQGEEDGAVPG